MTTITYGPTKSREGLKHAGKNVVCNSNRIIRGGNRSISAARRGATVKQVTAEQAAAEFMRNHGECSVVDGEVVWTLPKKRKTRTNKVERREEDYWKRSNVSKVTPMSEKPTSCAARGDRTTKDQRFVQGKNPYDSGLRSERAAPLGIESRNVVVPQKVYDAERQAFRNAVEAFKALRSADL